jgi:deoxyribodipyrimidine photo-lyase
MLMQKPGIHLVWLKRDLRIADHAALHAACRNGNVVVLYVYEPELLAAAEHDSSHLVFINQSLRELDIELQKRGAQLTVRRGQLPEVFEALHQEHPIAALYSHEETGGDLTYKRDTRVAAWAKSHGIPWHEPPQFGVFRRLRSRDGWASKWEERMLQPILRAPDTIPSAQNVESGHVLDAADLGLAASTKSAAQVGGETSAIATVRSFLGERGMHYRADMSSPESGWEGCSRLSPHLAYGTISLRTVYKRTLRQAQNVKLQLQSAKPTLSSADAKSWLNSLTSFQGRLHWHCHFMQKLESQPAIEFQNISRSYDGLRENDHNTELFEAWKAGQTGYPMIDACMRALHQTGWINFRMRAMLVSFAAYDLWLHWRPVGVYLATQFLDYEPGIHFSQLQMQSGTTGINTLRIYNPVKQAQEQDPTGAFIRRYVPELRELPTEYLAAPWMTPPLLQLAAGCVIGKQYPLPIVDHLKAIARAKLRIAQVRGTGEERREARAVHERHGSRRGPRTPHR